jgi:hypothetical protein
MSTFGTPKDCMNGCGGIIYFDAHSSLGHPTPTPDKWVPLEFKEGRKTDTIHICPNKKQNGTLPAVVTTAAAITTPNQNKLDLDGLAMIKVIAMALNEYLAIKEQKEIGKSSQMSSYH